MVRALVVTGLALGATLAHAATYNMAAKNGYTLFDTAISTEAPPTDLFPATDGLKTWLPPRFLAQGVVGSKAIPTNNWWGNMIASSGDADAQSVWTNPYVLRALTTQAPYGLSVNYPYPNRFYDGWTGHGNFYYASSIASDFVMSASEFTAAPTLQVTSWDDLGVSMSFSASTTTKIDATLVPGMGLITAKYTALTPKIVVVPSNILTINGAAVFSGSSVTNSRFALTLENGQKWVLYAGSSITLTLSGTKTLTAASVYTGYIRLALVVSDAQLAALDKSASCLLEGSNVEAKDATAYMFHLKTSGDCSNGLFHYLQVHHIDTLDTSSATVVSSSTAYSATRGPMTGVLTTSTPPVLRFSETQNVPVSFYPSRTPRADIIVNQKIKETLVADINATWDVPLNGSYYFNGKAAHKYANLCLMANDVAISGSDKANLTRQCLSKLEDVFTPMLNNSWTFRLNYDTTYRGIISPLGIINNDVNADFGNTMYNDHHYHYGYWIAASAIMNYLDPAWSGLAQLNRVTKFLIRDVANPANSDVNFPKFRQFDWFRGHSYSHGVTAVLDGKDEESTSEDINFHYAVALFGKATNNAALQNIGQLMLKLNTRSVQNYFLMESGNRVHPSTIVSNKVTGILWDNKVVYMTWFSNDEPSIHGIQMIPITPVTEFVRTSKFISEEWDTILSKTPDVVNNNVANPWLSLLYANYATINMTLALEKLQVANMDDGLTRSWALYMAASSASTITPPVTTTPAPTTPAPTTPAPTTPAPTTPAPTTPAPTTPAPTTQTPAPTTPVPTTTAPPTAAPGGSCGNDKDGPMACPTGQYCQPWNPSFYQCRSIGSALCGTQLTGIDFYGDDLATVQVNLPELCCDKCRATTGCAAYTFVNYNADGKAYCYLKKGTGTIKKATGVVSAVIGTTATTAPPTTSPPTTPPPTTPAPTTTVPTAAPGGSCGNDKDGPMACPTGQYCQPWNPSFYQCRSIGSASCGTQRTGIDFYGDDLATVQVNLPELCCDKCRATTGCAAYTFVNYNADGKAYCYLKKGTGTIKPAVGVVSAVIGTTATTAPPPTTPAPTTTAPPATTAPTCATPSLGKCGSAVAGVSCCPSGQYCQPWNPTSYQCIPAPSQCGPQEVNVDYYGSDIKTIEGILPADCCNACASTGGCVAYTFVNYNSNGKSACYLKSGLGTKKTAVGVVSSTVINPKAKCTYSSNADFYGNDLSSATGLTSATQCCDKCASTSGCAAFTYANSVCYMKKSAGTKSVLTGGTSGVVN